jgi:hypothetical protein
MAISDALRPNNAPTTSTGDMPPISPQISAQVQSFSRLMSRIFAGATCQGLLKTLKQPEPV